MELALDPYMIRDVPLEQLPSVVADLGYEYIELSPRDDFLPPYLHPRADDAMVARLKRALDVADVKLASVLPVYRWSGPGEESRRAAMQYWKRAIEIVVDLGCSVVNTEFNGRPDLPEESEALFWRSMEELLPILENEGIEMRIEPHPDDFVEKAIVAIQIIRGVNSPLVSYLHCAPHTFHLGASMADIVDYAGDRLRHVHIADAFDQNASSGLRYVLNPPGTPARVHQHLDIGQGEVDWDGFFAKLQEVGFDGVMTVCVFAWEERARQSSIFNREMIEKHISSW